MTRDRAERDSGLTLVELVISVALVSLLASVISAAVVVTLRTSPAVANRADAAVNVQGLVTWLPQDVDSATPGSFDTSQAATSGCDGVDPGFNLLKMTWSETMSSTVDYVASYRYVEETEGGRIVRVHCILGAAPKVLNVTGLIPPWVDGSEPVTVFLSDSVALADAPPDAPLAERTDGLIDSAKFLVRPVVGKTIVIDATTKNPNETLTTTTLPPTSEPPAPTPNQPPIASDNAATIDSDTDVTVGLSATDPEGGALTVSVAEPPVGWTITAGSGTSLVVRAPATAIGTSAGLAYTVTDPLGASASAQVTITVSDTASNQPPQASPATAFTDAGDAVTFALPATDPEGAALSATFSGVPADWTVTAVGLLVTITPPSNALLGEFSLGYTVTDPDGLVSSSTITVTVTAPPPCIIDTSALDPTSVALKKNDPDAITKSVDVTITILDGYCVGLALHYDTGGPNGQYVLNFGDTGTTRTVTLPGHPSPELWSSGMKALDVRDGTSTVIGTFNLQVTP